MLGPQNQWSGAPSDSQLDRNIKDHSRSKKRCKQLVKQLGLLIFPLPNSGDIYLNNYLFAGIINRYSFGNVNILLNTIQTHSLLHCQLYQSHEGNTLTHRSLSPSINWQHFDITSPGGNVVSLLCNNINLSHNGRKCQCKQTKNIWILRETFIYYRLSHFAQVTPESRMLNGAKEATKPW